MTKNPSLNDIADDLEATLVRDGASDESGENARASIMDLFAAKKRQLAETYFNSDFRMRLMSALETQS